MRNAPYLADVAANCRETLACDCGDEMKNEKTAQKSCLMVVKMKSERQLQGPREGLRDEERSALLKADKKKKKKKKNRREEERSVFLWEDFCH